MRKKLFTLLFAVMACTNFIHADFVQNVIGPTQTITYHFYTESRTAEVVGYQLVSGEVVIPEEILWADVYYRVTGIGESAFGYCSSLTSITMPDLLEIIGDRAFAGCTNLTNIAFPFNRLKSIGESAFSGCSGLTSMKIPNSVISIGGFAFANCTGLTSVTIGNSVTSIGIYAFWNCSSLTSVTILNGATNIGWGAFAGCSALPIENNIRYAGTYLVEVIDKSLSSYVIKQGTRWIGNAAFWQCSNLTSIEIPNSVTSIGANAFEDCESLTSVTIPNSVISIGDYAFRGCISLTSVMIPNSVTSIGWGVFYYCSGLTSITIPNSVTSIGYAAFEYCKSLTSITNYATEPQVIDKDVFGGDEFEEDGIQYGPVDKTTCILYVPAQSINLYKAADVWKEFLQILPINEAKEGIENVQRDDVQCTKVLHNGQIYILQGDKTYTLQGQELR